MGCIINMESEFSEEKFAFHVDNTAHSPPNRLLSHLELVFDIENIGV